MTKLTPPVAEGDVISGKIDSLGEKGDGVLKIGTFVIFVPDVVKDEEVKLKITRVLKKYAFAEKIKE